MATLYHYLFNLQPYAFASVPVILGSLGGVGLIVGPIGLWCNETRCRHANDSPGGNYHDDEASRRVIQIRPSELRFDRAQLRRRASPTTGMTHIAIQEVVGGKNVNSMEKVSDEQDRE